MKIIVDKIPAQPRQCLFSERSPWGFYVCTIKGKPKCENTAKCRYIKERSATIVTPYEDDLK